MRIDIHCHFVPEAVLNYELPGVDGKSYSTRFITDSAGRNAFYVGDWGLGTDAGDPRKYFDVDWRLRDMDKMRMDVQVISLLPPLYSYQVEPKICLEFCRRVNNGLAEIARAYPNRFVTMATVPLQNPELAIGELERAVRELGCKAVSIGTHIAGRNLDEPSFYPLFQKAIELNIPVYVHPHRVLGRERLKDYHLGNLIGNPTETAVAAACIIFGGILERLPNLKVILSHAGGTAPYLRGRWEHGYRVRGEAKVNIPKPPSEYFKLLYFDTITHWQPTLSYLIRTVGANRVMLGTDYPADMADGDPVSAVLGLSDISAEDKEMVLEKTARELVGL